MIELCKKPEIFEYEDIIHFMNDMQQYLSTALGRSNFWMVKQAGFKSPGYLNTILTKKRRLSLKAAEKFAVAFELKGIEKEYFMLLCQIQLTTEKEKSESLRQSLKHLQLRYRTISFSDAAIEGTLNPISIFVLEWMAAQNGAVPAAELKSLLAEDHQDAERIFSEIVGLGLIFETADGWVRSGKTFKTAPELSRKQTQNFHLQMLERAKSSVENVPVEERFLQSLVIGLSEEEYQELKALVRGFVEKVNDQMSNKLTKDRQIYQVGVQVFPFSIKR